MLPLPKFLRVSWHGCFFSFLRAQTHFHGGLGKWNGQTLLTAACKILSKVVIVIILWKKSPLMVGCCSHSLKFWNFPVSHFCFQLSFSQVLQQANIFHGLSHLNDFPGYFKMKSLRWRGSSCLFLVRNLYKAQNQRFWSILLGENPQLNSFWWLMVDWPCAALSWKINGSSKVFSSLQL